MPGTRVYLKLAETATGVRIQLKNISNYELNEDAEKLVERFTRVVMRLATLKAQV